MAGGPSLGDSGAGGGGDGALGPQGPCSSYCVFPYRPPKGPCENPQKVNILVCGFGWWWCERLAVVATLSSRIAVVATPSSRAAVVATRSSRLAVALGGTCSASLFSHFLHASRLVL